jgi:hypothetical protein
MGSDNCIYGLCIYVSEVFQRIFFAHKDSVGQVDSQSANAATEESTQKETATFAYVVSIY